MKDVKNIVDYTLPLWLIVVLGIGGKNLKIFKLQSTYTLISK